ncbi:MAG: hypothetical protein M1838_000123 [Thelocarpon superellum]|nr:MAG: hypothetical protein M1838_000123 [Thelocarpon superellum]
MPKYAILGATGQAGSELVKLLLEDPAATQLHLYARSAERLSTLHPAVASTEKASTFIGEVSDVALLTNCIRGSDVVFNTVAQNTNEPTVDIAQRVAHGIVSALELLREEAPTPSAWTCPTLVFLSSAAVNPKLPATLPPFFQWLMRQGEYNVYGDIKHATAYLQSQTWLPLVLAQSGGLVHDKARGVRISATEVSPLLSYADLARGMVMMSGRDGDEQDGAGREEWVGKEVGLVGLGGKEIDARSMSRNLFSYLLPGLVCQWFPSLWRVGRWCRFW